jgi:OOP family OmpA-OmpF porin
LKHGDARFDDLALTLSGEAEDAAAFKTINAALKGGLPKGIRLASSQVTGPVVSPYTWSAQFAGGQLVLGGYVAGGEKGKSDLLAAVKAAVPAANVVDRMEPGEGAPQSWVSAATALVKELVRLESGAADMKDTALSVSGIASDEVQAQSIRAALRGSLPNAFTLVDQIKVREIEVPAPPVIPIDPPPFERMAPAPGPSPAASQPTAPPAEAPAKQAAPTSPKSPDIAPKQVAPAPTPAPEKQAASPSPPLVQQQASPTPPREPAAKSEPVPKSEPPPKVAVAPSQAPPAPVSPQVRACQDNLNKIKNAGHINFATNSATLDSESFATLDQLAAAAKVCPGMRIAIEGHTDSEGTPEYNQRLSVRRARAVAAYLIKAGADRKQLEAVGYGFSRPAAPNDTEENMAKNRRIEFIVRQQ